MRDFFLLCRGTSDAAPAQTLHQIRSPLAVSLGGIAVQGAALPTGSLQASWVLVRVASTHCDLHLNTLILLVSVRVRAHRERSGRFAQPPAWVQGSEDWLAARCARGPREWP